MEIGQVGGGKGVAEDDSNGGHIPRSKEKRRNTAGLKHPLILARKESRRGDVVSELNREAASRVAMFRVCGNVAMAFNLRFPAILQADLRDEPMRTTRVLSFNDVRDFIDGVFDGEIRVKRVLSLANASLVRAQDRVPGG
jgi:hypothetical protein